MVGLLHAPGLCCGLHTLSDINMQTCAPVPRAALVNFVCPDALGSLATFKRVFGDPILRSRDRGASQCVPEAHLCTARLA
jgi:hypothetical protein